MPKSKTYMTVIRQTEVKVLNEEDYDGYEKDKPGSKWELVEYFYKDENGNSIKQISWIPNYKLKYPKIEDHSKVTIQTGDKDA